jgi:hypothetical protein
MGENVVSISAIDDVGDCLARSLERSLFTRYLYGMGFGMLMGHDPERCFD